MLTGCGIGYHILHDKMTPEQLSRLLRHLRTVQPAVVNVTGAERYPASLGFVRHVLEACPRTLVFERRVAKPNNQGGDEGIWAWDLDGWYDWRIAPYLDVLSHPRVVVVYDNESSMADMRPYAEKMAEAIWRAEVDEVALCVGRFPTGNPGEHQYAQMDAMWYALADSRSWWGPNEYAGPTPQASAGNLHRYKLGWQRCDALRIARPKTMIGETGVSAQKEDGSLDSHRGYRITLGWSETRLVNTVLANSRTWHLAYGVPVCYYVPEYDLNQGDDWAEHIVGETFYKAVEEQVHALQIPLPWLENSDTTPVRLYEDMVARLVGAVALRVRADKSTDSPTLGMIRTGDRIGYLPPVQGQEVGDMGDLWVPVDVPGDPTIEGYVFRPYLWLPGDPEPEPMPEDPPEQELPEPTPEQVAAIREGMKTEILRLWDEVRAAILQL